MKKFLLTIFIFLAVPAAAIAAGSTLGDSNNTATLTSGLVGYWSMDGNKINWLTGKVTDVSGSGNTGQLTNFSTTTAPVAGKVGGALKFSGSSSYITTGYTIPAQSSATSFTWSLWVRLADNSGTKVIAGFRNGATWVKITPNAFEYSAGGIISYTVPTGQWVNLTVVKNGTSFTYYSNNTVVGTAVSASSVVSGTFYLGEDPGFPSDGAVSGLMDEARIYTRALSAQEVGQLYKNGSATVGHSSMVTLQSGLAGYWPLDGNTTNWKVDGTTDVTGNGNLGQLIGMSTTTSPVPGKIGGALNFNGSTQYAVSTSPSTTVTNWTLAGWIYPAALPQLSLAVYNGNDAGGYGFGVGDGAGGSGSKLQVLFGSVSWLDPSFSLTAGKWYYVVMTRDSATTRVYVNGTLLATTFSNTPGTVVNKFTIGMQFSGINATTRFFNGKIDDVRVYSRALSAQEVQQLYGNGAATIDHSNTTTASQNNLLLYYTFDGPKINWATSAVLDSSGNNFTSAAMLMPTSTSPTAGKIGQGLKFTGNSGAYILTPSLGTPVASITEAAWIKPNAAGGIVLDELGNPTTGSLWHDSHMEVETNNSIKVCVWIASSSCVTAATGITYGKWYHVVLVYNSTTQILSGYVNGTLGASASGVVRLTPNTGQQVFGIGLADATNGGNGSAFSGVIDDVRVYSTALTATQVQQLYTLGR